MILRLLRADFQKLKFGMWALVFLGPIGIFALQSVNYGIRYNSWLITLTDDYWRQLLQQINILLAPSLLFGIALLASLAAGIEHQSNAWRKLLSLPISRVNVYCSKLIMISILLMISTCITFIGTLLFGHFFDWEQPVPYRAIAINSFYPFFAALPILALQLWLSITNPNQGIPIMIGIIGAVVSMYGYGGPEWLIWKWPHLENQWGIPEISLMLGIVVGTIFLITSMIDFNRRDVK